MFPATTIDAAPAEVRVISRASVSNVPAFPKKLPILIVATLAALFLTAAFVCGLMMTAEAFT